MAEFVGFVILAVIYLFTLVIPILIAIAAIVGVVYIVVTWSVQMLAKPKR